MTDTAYTGPRHAEGEPMSLTTPTGLQSIAELSRRRRLVLGLNVVSWLAMM